MFDFEALEPTIDPCNRISFLLDWELTMKCNLDCSYCRTGIDGSHDNTTSHPPLQQCIDTIEFMFQYVDLYMQRKPKGIRYVVLNVYGGESLHHPHISTILKHVHQIYRDTYRLKWQLTVTTTTNAIVSKKKLDTVIPFIDEFTVSFHSENNRKQMDLFRSNIMYLRERGKRIKCIILMHAKPELFRLSQQMIEWCQHNEIKFLPRQLDHNPERHEFNYMPEQTVWFDKLYKDKAYNSQKHVAIPIIQESVDLAKLGRACCGGRSFCKDQSYKQRDFYISNRFPNWHCSVNEFFLFVKQINGEIYTNKDCKMNFNGQIGPIGNLNNKKTILDYTKKNLETGSMPIIQCQKTRCYCGLCAPKAKHKDTYSSIMKKYRV